MTRCLETRLTPEGHKRRRYEGANGLRWTTIEVPMELWDSVKVVKPRNHDAKQRAIRLHESGDSAQVIALRLNVSKKTIWKWLREARVNHSD